MAVTLTIAGTDRTAVIYGDSLKIEQVADSYSAVCSFTLNDPTSALAIVTRDAVVVDDGGTTIFAGEVVDVDDSLLSLALDGRRLDIRCRDYQALVEEAVVEGPHYFTGVSDANIILFLFSAYRPDIDIITHVATLAPALIMSFGNMTLRQAMADLCARTGGRWYVDELLRLHYFDTEANVAGWFLSDTPDNATSFPYQDIKRRLNGATIVNRILVVGDDVDQWYEDAASIALYDERPAIVIDNRLTTAGGLAERGAAILAKWAYPRVSYEVVTRHEGLRAGMDVRLVCGAWGIDATLTVRRLTISWRFDVRFYRLELGDGIGEALTSGRTWVDRLAAAEGAILTVDGTIFDTDPPAAPVLLPGNLSTGVDIEPDGTQSVYLNVTWGAVADTDLDHYTVQVGEAADLSGYNITRDHPADGDRQEHFAPLPGNTLHYVRVRAVDWVGNVSPWSDIRSITTALDNSPPAQVQGLNAASARTLVGINWTANGEADLAHYDIQRTPDNGAGAPDPLLWAIIATADLNFYIDQDFTDEQIAAQDIFWYRARAVDTSGNAGAWSVEADAQIGLITGDHIAADTITAFHIFAHSITAEELNVDELSAISADLGTVTAGTITSATIRTAAAAARIQLDSVDGLQAINAGDVTVAQILTTGAGHIGAASEIAWNAAGGITVDGGILVNGTVVATKFSNAVGDPIFSATGGSLLLGPHCQIELDAWTSTRGQIATLTGAFHQQAGAWLGTRALVVEQGTTNLHTNPSLEVDTTNWTAVGVGTTVTRVTTDAVFGSACAEVAVGDVAGAGVNVNQTNRMAVTGGTTYTASIYARVVAEASYAATLQIHWYNAGSVFISTSSQNVTLGPAWARYSVTAAAPALAVTAYVSFVRNVAGVHTLHYDGAQFEAALCATSYCDGMRGSGYAWTGTAHASTSTRTVTTATLDSHIYLLSLNATYSARILAQAPYTAAGAWPTAGNNMLWGARGANDDNRVFVAFDSVADTISLYINGAVRCSSAAQIFPAGAWLDVVVTLDFSTDSYKLYIDGELVDTDTTALTSPTLTGWDLGHNYLNTGQGGFAIAEYALFDTVLTADDVAALYAMNRPLVDCGALDVPGIYLYDGRFRIASAATGNRIEITSDEVAGYDSAGTKQFYLSSTDGVAYAGAGAVILDEDGISVTSSGAGAANLNSYKFISGSTIYIRLAGYHVAGTGHAVNLEALSIASEYSSIYLQARSPASEDATVGLYAYEGANEASISIEIDGATHAETIYINCDDTIQLAATTIEVTGNIQADGGIMAGDRTLTAPAGVLGIKDAVAAPATVAGAALIYVDSGDGDLKVKFGDGVVKTLAVDS